MAKSNPLETDPMYQQLMNMRRSIVSERILEMYFFSPETVELAEEMVRKFLNKCNEQISTIEKNKSIADPSLSKCFEELKEASAKIGAHKVNSEVNKTIQHFERKNIKSVEASFDEMKKELDTLKERLDAYFEIAYQLKALSMCVGK